MALRTPLAEPLRGGRRAAPRLRGVQRRAIATPPPAPAAPFLVPDEPAAERAPTGLVEAERAVNRLLVDSVARSPPSPSRPCPSHAPAPPPPPQVFIINKLYSERPFARFYVLETARSRGAERPRLRGGPDSCPPRRGPAAHAHSRPAPPPAAQIARVPYFCARRVWPPARAPSPAVR